MKWLCRFGVHWRVQEGGGLQGDALKCCHCGRDKYPETFGFWVVKKYFDKSSI